MAGRFLLPRATAFDENGNPIPGAKLEFFESSTTTQQTTYSDDALTVPNTNPVIADSIFEFVPPDGVDVIGEASGSR